MITQKKIVVGVGSMRYYTLKACNDLIASYVEKAGFVVEVEEGSLGLGVIALLDPTGKLKNFIIKERYLNEWSSTHTIQIITDFNKVPKKYIRAFENQ